MNFFLQLKKPFATFLVFSMIGIFSWIPVETFAVEEDDPIPGLNAAINESNSPNVETNGSRSVANPSNGSTGSSQQGTFNQSSNFNIGTGVNTEPNSNLQLNANTSLNSTPRNFPSSNNPSGQGQYSGLDANGKPVYSPPSTNTGARPQGAGQAATGAVGSCAVGSILGSIIGGTLGTVIGEGTNAVVGLVSGYTDPDGAVAIATDIPTKDKTAKVGIDRGNAISAQRTQKDVSASASGGGSFVGSLLSNIKLPSLDAVAYCIANEMIRYIADSTIEWINSGFEGNPVFVDNPEQFFGNIADQEAGAFVQSLGGSLTKNAFGEAIDVCQPFKVRLSIDTISAYNSRYRGGQQLNCSLSQIKENYDRFVGGDFNAGGFGGWFEILRDENNLYGARYKAEEEIGLRISAKQNTATVELNWAKGYRNFKVCDGTKDASGKCSVPLRTTTMGGYIEHTVNARGSSPQNRLEIADEFDEIVSALVNQLIRIAINETFEDPTYGDPVPFEENRNEDEDERDEDPVTPGVQPGRPVITLITPDVVRIGNTISISGRSIARTRNDVIFRVGDDIFVVPDLNSLGTPKKLYLTINNEILTLINNADTQFIDTGSATTTSTTTTTPANTSTTTPETEPIGPWIVGVTVQNRFGTSNEFFIEFIDE